jgi:hypothetical protein
MGGRKATGAVSTDHTCDPIRPINCVLTLKKLN